jgi:hypothetical protein
MPANGTRNLTRAGRPKGVPNKASADVRVRARALVEDPVYVLGLKRRILDGKSVPLEIMLHHYAYGKPSLDRRGLSPQVRQDGGRDQPFDPGRA